RAVRRGMGKSRMGTGEAEAEDRARHAAEAAIATPLLDDVSMHGARGLLISITGGPDLTLYEVDEAASRIREEVDTDCNIILGATYDPSLTGTLRISVATTGTDATLVQALDSAKPHAQRTPLPLHRQVPLAPPWRRPLRRRPSNIRSRPPWPKPSACPLRRPRPMTWKTMAFSSSPISRPPRACRKPTMRPPWPTSRCPASMCRPTPLAPRVS